MNIKKSAALIATLLLPFAVAAQNVAIVNGKPVPKSRLDVLLKNAVKDGAPPPPALQAQARDQVVLREIYAQQAEKDGIQNSPDYKNQLELVRQTVLINTLFQRYIKAHPVTDAEAKAEYDKVKSQNAGTEYHARHILVDNEDDAKKLIAQINAGAKFDELAKKNSKDTGSAENGGDLDWAKPTSYVPEFATALQGLKPGQVTPTPVKTQFGYHIIKLEETRAAQFPAYDDVKDKLKEQMAQMHLQDYQDQLRKAAKTDYKFTPPDAQGAQGPQGQDAPPAPAPAN